MEVVTKKPMGTFTFNVENKVIGGTELLTVSARELHKELEVGRDFSTWVKDRIEKVGFVENQDFIVLLTKFGEQKVGRGGQNSKEYYLTLDTAKHLCMMENNERGHQARRYFIEVEKQYHSKTTEIDYEQALRLALDQVVKNKELEKQLALAAPKVEFADAVLASEELLTINAYCKWVHDKHNLKIGEHKMFAFLRSSKYLMDGRNPSERNLPYQRYIEDGTFVANSDLF